MRLRVNTILLAGLIAGPASAAIVKGPYLQDVRPDRITVVAETDAGSTCRVLWGDQLAQQVELTTSGNHHEGLIEGLQPSTCYAYQLECDAETSPQASFCAAPTGDEPFSFVLFGDTRSDHVAHAEVIRAVSAEGVDFYINTGDLVSDGAEETDWVPFFEIEGDLMRDVPMYPVVGNHDESGGQIENYARLFAPPQDASGSENYYAFTYGNVRFIALDNQATPLGRPVDQTDQGIWLAAELARTAADAAIEHTFVLVHANMYSADDGRSGEEGLRLWQDEFVAAGVDVVFSGHDHHYVRGHAPNGLKFVVAGGGGAPLYDLNPDFETAGTPKDVVVWGWLPEPGDKPFTLIWTNKVHHYLRIDVQGTNFSACAKEVIAGGSGTGTQFDCFEKTAEPDPDPDPDPKDTKDGGCSTSGTGESIALLLLALGLAIRRKR